MKRHLLIVFLMLSGLGVGYSQIPFAQVNNTPLLTSPSQAGSKQKLRMAIARNVYSSEMIRYSNIYSSADVFIKKIGTGISFYYLRSVDKEKLDQAWLNASMENGYGQTSRTMLEMDRVGFSIAPKYNVYARKETGKIAFSLSPSLFLERGRATIYTMGNVPSYYSLYNKEYPYGNQIRDSLYVIGSRVSGKEWRYGFGMMLNSERLSLLYKNSWQSEKDVEHSSVFHMVGAFPQEYFKNFNNNYSVFSMDHQLTASLRFPAKEKAKVTFIPMAGIGYIAYLNVPRDIPKTTTETYYSLYLHSLKNSFHYRHLSMNFRIAKILTGLSYTYSSGRVYKGLNLGFQSERIRVNTTWALPIKKSQEDYLFNELSITFLL